MSAAGRVIALRGHAPHSRSSLMSRTLRRASVLAVVAGRGSALARTVPGAVVTFSGVQGGAGVSTTVLLACGAVTRTSDRPAVAIDVAGTRGGLGGLAGAWSQTSAEATARLVIGGASLARPYVQTEDGVHVISDAPQAAIAIDQTARKLLTAAANAVARHAGDDELAAITRAGAETAALEELAGVYPADQRAALEKLIRTAAVPHSLVALDLGLADDATLARHARVSDLHVWVVAARRHDLEVARRRLLGHEAVAARELVLAWQPNRERVGSRALRSLGEARGCPVVRLATFNPAEAWADRERTCRSGLEALCRHVP
jgi:hypothetical protein